MNYDNDDNPNVLHAKKPGETEKRELTPEEQEKQNAWDSLADANDNPYFNSGEQAADQAEANDEHMADEIKHETAQEKKENDASSAAYDTPDETAAEKRSEEPRMLSYSEAVYKVEQEAFSHVDQAAVERQTFLDNNMDAVREDTYNHQMRGVSMLDQAMADSGFGRSGEDITSSLVQMYRKNNSLAEDANRATVGYAANKYMLQPLDDPVNYDPDAAATKNSDGIFESADSISRNYEMGLGDVSDTIRSSMGGEVGDIFAKNVDNIASDISSFERKYAALTKDFIDDPSEQNRAALTELVSDYEADLQGNIHEFNAQANESFDPRTADALTEVMQTILNNAARDIEDRDRSMKESIRNRFENSAGSASDIYGDETIESVMKDPDAPVVIYTSENSENRQGIDAPLPALEFPPLDGGPTDPVPEDHVRAAKQALNVSDEKLAQTPGEASKDQ